jgi:DNA polymerase-1
VAPLLVVDAPSLLFRAFHALPDSIVDSRKRPVNALLGTANLLLYAIEERAPRATVLCFGQDAADYRTELYPPYHADRVVMPDGLGHQFADAGDFFGAFGFEVANQPGLEADDLMGSYAGAESEASGEALLMTGDRDMFQCAGERVQVLYVKTGTRGFEQVGPKEVLARYGVTPDLVPDFIALRGDSSDRIPGASGVGPGRAATILKRYGSLDAAIQGGAFPKQADDLREYLRIARLQYEAPIPDIPDGQPQWERASKVVGDWGLKALSKRLGERA